MFLALFLCCGFCVCVSKFVIVSSFLVVSQVECKRLRYTSACRVL